VDSNFLEKHDAYNFRVEGSGVTVCSGYRPIATITWTLVTQNYGNGKEMCLRRRKKVPGNHVYLLTRLNCIRTLNITIKSVTAMKISDLTIRTLYESNRCFMKASTYNRVYIPSLIPSVIPVTWKYFLQISPLVQLYTAPSDCIGVGSIPGSYFAKAFSALLLNS
jgi:hypothetical protein